jgi:hypothetical protein
LLVCSSHVSISLFDFFKSLIITLIQQHVHLHFARFHGFCFIHRGKSDHHLSFKLLSSKTVFTLRSLAPWFLVLACIDRFWCSSSSINMRTWSSVRVTTRAISITILLMCLGYSHLFIFATIEYIPAIQQYSCNSQVGVYRTFFALWNLIVFSFGPPILMFIFGLLTLRHLHQTKRVRDHSSSFNQNQTLRNTNRHALRMLLVQCLVIIVTGAPFSIGWLYVSLTVNQNADILQVAKNNLLTNVVGYLSVTGSCISFYLFTLSSSLFRRELMALFKWCFCRGHV